MPEIHGHSHLTPLENKCQVTINWYHSASRLGQRAASMSVTSTLKNLANKHLWMHNADWTKTAKQGGPLIAVSGSGIRITDSEGESWIDVNGGYTSVNVGYGRTEIADSVHDQICNLAYFPQTSTSPATVKLAEKLAAITPGTLSRVFPVSGGSEANETAIKIARAYHNRRGEPSRRKIISRSGSYHGATSELLWLGSTPGASREDYKPVPSSVIHVPQPNPYRCELGGNTPSECSVLCATAIEKSILSHGVETIAAVIAEPVATPEGAVVPSHEYWTMVRDICDKYGVLLIADEIVTGFGRTGKMFAVDHWNIVPDIMTLAKGISSSYIPLGATIVKEEIAQYFSGGMDPLLHVFTSAGHPVAAAAALKNIEILENEGLVHAAAETGEYFKGQLESLLIDHPTVGDVRGIGLLLCFELVANKKTKIRFAEKFNITERLNEKFKTRRLILRSNNGIVNIGPPLCITREEVDEIMHSIDLSLWELEGELGIISMI